MRERQCGSHPAEHREDADAEAEQRRDPGGEDDHEQDQGQRQRHHLGAAEVAREVRVEVVGEGTSPVAVMLECARMRLAHDFAVLRTRLREVDVHPHLHEHAVLSVETMQDAVCRAGR